MAYLGALKTLRRELSQKGITKAICSSAWLPARIENVLPPLESFSRRHIGPSESEVAEMLETCGVMVSSVVQTLHWFDVVNVCCNVS